MRARDFRAKARAALKGKWALAILVCLIAGILNGTVCTQLDTSAGSALSSRQENSVKTEELEQKLDDLLDAYNTATPAEQKIFATVGKVGLGAVTIGVLGAILRLLIGGAVSFGYATFNLNLVDGDKEAGFGDLFSKMHIGKGFLMNLLMGLYILLWTLLFIIPGIIKSFSYAMTPYILAENPMLTVNEAITKSRKLMNGNKWRLFCLSLSFIGWDLLAALTFGIADLWINPYKECARAAFYRQISAEKAADRFWD